MKIAVLLFNLGGPGNLKEVRPFLFRLFNDPAILGAPQPWRSMMAWFLALGRCRAARKIYAQTGGRSLLFENTEKQAHALEKELGGAGDVRCFVGMRYASPFIRDAWREISSFAPSVVVQLPLYPQFSTTTTGSSLEESARRKNFGVPVRTITDYPELEGFVRFMADRTREAYDEARQYGQPKILLSAHGLPERRVRMGDPYPLQCEKTARAFMRALSLPEADATLCYQSRIGPVKWIGPQTRDEIVKAGRAKRPVVVVPISFVSEHAETLVEIDREYADLAARSGVPLFLRAPVCGTDPAFIGALAALVRDALR